ncbi:MAG: rRNA pseudouridine synthase [FCB group bacterium]|nr:rRNA pseudouridine synthase [FCB group bacterium]
MPTDEVVYDGRRLEIEIEPTVVMLNKPKGVITTARDPQNRPTVFDFIPSKTRLFPIGRLDKDTTGLILLTNDGELANFLLHPRHQIPRLYVCEIEGRLSPRIIAKMSKGIFIGDGEFGRCQVLRQNTVKKRSKVTLKLTQGKKREIRRMFSALKIRLFALHRIQYGPVKLGKLPAGRWRTLTSDEIASLRELRKRKGKTAG